MDDASTASVRLPEPVGQRGLRMAFTGYLMNGRQMAQEYRRTCEYCGKTWHSLVSREKQIEDVKKQAALATIGNGCGDNSQNMRNIDAGSDSLTKLRQCPECGSANYKEELIGEK